MAQGYAPTEYEEVIITENFGVTTQDYVARVEVNTLAKINVGNMQANGADIRFFGATDVCFGLPYNHYVESGMNTTNTVIWVKLPVLAANASDTIRMYYGDATAPDISNFNNTFPNAVINPGTISLGGLQNVGWLELGPSDQINIPKDSILEIRAGKVIIQGTVDGEGQGYGNNNNGVAQGLGPGGGNAGTSSGAGGGGYGGAGGDGGYDSNDPINSGGSTYGTVSGTDVDLGSAGGNASSIYGGNGGAAVIIRARSIDISGTINVDGAEGEQPGAGQGGGGGSGGAVLIEGDSILLSGNITANGGNGSVGASTANDDGGGGGGGRIKIFSSANYTNTGSLSVNGGIGGPNGGIAADDGSNGSTFEGSFTFTAPIIGAVGAPPTSNTITTNINPVVCNSYTAPDGQTYNQSGQYQALLVASSGCDSLVNIDLTVNVPTTSTVSEVACDQYTAPNGVVYSQSGQYLILAQNAAGCDSTITLNLTVNNSVSSSISETACDSLVAPDGQVFYNTGQYQSVIPSSLGCDSTININLTILQGDQDFSTEVACESYTAPDGQTYTTSGTYDAVLTNQNGCDSVITVDLTINNGSAISLTETACNSYIAPDGSVINSSGQYQVVLPVVNGCDSTFNIDLTVNEADATIQVNSPNYTIFAQASGDYQWIDCSTNQPVAGESESQFTATASGSYALVITNNGCSDTSDCVTFENVGMVENTLGSEISVFPNPTNGQLFLVAPQQLQNVMIEVTTLTGQLVTRKQVPSLQNATLDLMGEAGVYFVTVTDQQQRRAIFKVVKH